jgi:hypothetical protein
MKKEQMLGVYQDEVQTGVNLTAFLTGVTVFFTGLLITKFNDYDLSIKIPILFLIISTFGFLYATLILGNASTELSRLKTERFHKCMNIGDAIAEFIGVYFLVLAIPLVINVITADNFLRLSTLIVSMGGLIIYHLSGFSIMQDYYKKAHLWLLLIIIILEIILFVTRKQSLLFVSASTITIIYLLAIAFFSRNRRTLS